MCTTTRTTLAFLCLLLGTSASSSTLFGSNQVGTFQIDPVTGVAALISTGYAGGFAGYQRGSSLTFGDGRLFGANEVGTYVIDTISGATSLLSDGYAGGYAGYQNGSSLTFGDGMLFGANEVGTVAIDPLSGATTLLRDGYSGGFSGYQYGSALTYTGPVGRRARWQCAWCPLSTQAVESNKNHRKPHGVSGYKTGSQVSRPVDPPCASKPV